MHRTGVSGKGAPNKPFAELYYDSKGVVQMGVAGCPLGESAGCGQTMTGLGIVPLDTPFSYDI